MPDCDQFILKCWHDLGLTSSSGMGESPINWTEVDSYNNLTDAQLTPFEADAIVMMSKAYIRFKHESTETRGTLSPYQPEITKQDLVARVSHFESKTKPFN